MAGAMHRMAYYLGLVQEDPADDFDDDVPMKPRPSSSRSSRSTTVAATTPAYEPEVITSRRSTPRTDVAPVTVITDEPAAWEAPVAQDAAYGRITTLHPRFYNDARRIGEEFRTGTPVIMNLTDMDDADAKRIVDFAAGLVFGLHGTIERVTSKVFLLSPANVDVGAEARAQLQQGGFFNQS
jgi:cell division inhibitor SepF